MMDNAHLSIGSFIQTFVDWLNVNYSMPFEILSALMEKSVKILEGILLFPPAFVVIAAASDPAPASVSPQAPSVCPLANLVRYFFFCSSLANRLR